MADLSVLAHGVARGELARVLALRQARHTRLARLLIREILVPEGEPLSPASRLYARRMLEHAFLLSRSEDPRDIAEAHAVVNELRARSSSDLLRSGTGTHVLIDGEYGANFLNDLAIVLGRLGRTSEGIEIADMLLERARKRGMPQMETIQLHNAAARRVSLAYERSLTGDRNQARHLLRRALQDHEQSLRRRASEETAGAEASRLVSKRFIVRTQFELALVDLEGAELVAALQVQLDEAREIFRLSRANPTIPILTVVNRAADVGMVYAERAATWAGSRRHEEAAQSAAIGLALMKALKDTHESDADEPLALSLRFAECWRLLGESRIARSVLQGTYVRASLLRGEDHPVARAVLARLEEVAG